MIDKMKLTNVYFWIGVLKGKARVAKNKQLLDDLIALEDSLDSALGYKDEEEFDHPEEAGSTYEDFGGETYDRQTT